MSDGVTAELIGEISRTLYEEANLLDGGQFEKWLGMLAADVTYEAPVRLTRERNDLPDVSPSTYLFSDNHETLALRVARLGTEYAWAEDPPSRTRHLITNVLVSSTESDDEYSVRSNLLLYRSRGGTTDVDLLAGQRHDVWRRTDAGWQLGRRVIILDQANLGTPNLAIFL